MLTDDKFYDKAKSFCIMEEVESGKFMTLEEYTMAAETLQTNKDKKTIVIYTTDRVQQDAYIKAAKAKGFYVVQLNDLIDPSWIGHIEMKYGNIQFVRVDADIAENLIDKGDNNESLLTPEQASKLVDIFKSKTNFSNAVVEVKGLSADAAPVVATRPEWSRRMKDMAQVNGGGGMMNFYASMPDEVNFTLNGNHSIHQQILDEIDEAKQEQLVRNLLDLALLSQGMLKGADLTAFIERSVSLMNQPTAVKV